MKLPRCLLYAFTLVTLMPIGLWADSVTYYLTDSNGSVIPSAASYGSITLTTNATGGIDVTIQMAPAYTIAGGGTAFAFNLGTGISSSNITISGLPTGFSSSLSGGNVNGFGFFGVLINGPPASSGVTTLTFTVSNANGGFSSVSQLIALSTSKGAPPADGYMDFAAHVVPVNGTSTGYVGANSTQVSEGSTLSLLLVTGFTSLGAILGRRRRG